VNTEDYTIVVFPGNASTPKKYRISEKFIRKGFISLLVLFLVMAGASTFFISQYFELKNDQVDVAEMRRDSKIQNIKMEKISHELKNFETEMARLGRFENKLRIITSLENSPKSVEKNFGVGGPYGLSQQSLDTSLEKESAGMLGRLSRTLDSMNKQVKIQTISFQELDEYLKNQKSLLSSTPSICPTRGWVTSGFGLRKSPFTGVREKHEGYDIGARAGSEIRATADGIVVVQGRGSGYGKMVEVDHGYGMMTRYGHNSKNLVKVGDRVKRGQVIALVGSTGRSTGPHLHYEVLLNGVPVSPKNYILED
jgi:murein DD-endopeptidase MepM/ murein hydrolase activator NlpD